MTRQVTDNLYIDLGYYAPEDYYTYEARAEAAFASAATFTCSADAFSIQSASADLSVVATQTVTATTIKDFSAAFTGAFSPSMTAIAIKNIGASVNVVASLTASVQRNRSVDIALSNIVNLSAQNDRIRLCSSSISTSATVSATGRLVTRFIGDPTVNSGTTYSTLEIDTATKQFGAGSLRFNQKLAADNTLKAHISFPDYAGFDTWKTIDFWIYMGTRPAGGSGVIPILRKGAYNQANAETAWLVSAVGTSNVNKYYITVTGWDTSGNAVGLAGTNSEGLFDANAWSHVRIVNNASASSLYINGVKLTNAAATGRNLPDTFRSNTAPLLIGGGSSTESGTDTVFAQYRLDEILITDQLLTDPSVSSFTVPSAPFVNSTDTDGLWHFDTDFRDDNLANVTFASALSATATQTAEAVRTRSTAVALTSTASVSATAETIRSTQSSLNTISTVSAQAQANFVSSADLAVQGFVLAAAGRIQSDVADLDVVSSLSATVTRNRRNSAALTSAFTVTAAGLDLDLASASLTSSFTLTGSLKGIQQNGRANLTSTATLAANVNENPLPANPNSFNYIDGFTLDFKPQFQLRRFGSNYNDRIFTNVTWVDIRSSTTPSSINVIEPGTQIGPVTVFGVENNNPTQSQSTLYGQFEVSVLIGTRVDIDTVRWRRRIWSSADTDQFAILTWNDATGWTYADLSLRIVADVDDPDLFKVYQNILGTGTYVLLSGTYSNLTPTEDIDGVITFAPTQFANIDSLFNVDDATANSPDFVSSTNTVTNVVYTPTLTAYSGPQEIGSADLRTTSNISADFITVKFGEANLAVTATQTATVTRRRNTSSALTSTVTVTVSATKTVTAQVALNSTTTVSAVASRTRGVTSAVAVTATVSAVPTITRTVDSALLTNFALSVSADRFRSADASLTVTASQTTVNTRVRDFDTDFVAIASQLSAVARVGDGFVAIDVNTSISATARKVTDTPINLTVASTLTADSNNILTASSDISAVSAITVNADKLKAIEAILSASIATTAVAVKNTVTASNLLANITATTVNSRTRLFNTTLQTTATVSAQAMRVKTANSNLFVSTQQFASPFFLVRVTANLQVTAFQLSAGQVINLDPYYTYLIPGETRAYIITEESRFYQIEQETRTLKI